MKTEELNDYLFADLVDNRAVNLLQRDTQEILSGGLTESAENEALNSLRPKSYYISKALAILCISKTLVFEALEKSDRE